ncbi:hypothetical protein EJ04DRAFT_446943, partial [Polyplosphaeria fusca]
NSELVHLLRNLALTAGEHDRKRIETALEEYNDDLPTTSPTFDATNLGKRSRGADISDDGREGDRLASLLESYDDADRVDEDLLRNTESKATGFVGHSSAVQWMKHLRHQIHAVNNFSPDATFDERLRMSPRGSHRPGSRFGSVPFVSDSTFYLDNENISVGVGVDPSELPPPDTADRLFECYKIAVQDSFPILPRTFEDQYRKFYQSKRQRRPLQTRVPERWLAVLNLVFAIGARYSHLIDANWKADDLDHIRYMTRAMRLLESEGSSVVALPPDLSIIQATGLLSIFYLTIGHVSRKVMMAWLLIGISLRFALAVGLHLRNENPSAALQRKEALVRTWWGLHSVETLLSTITGRPSIISDNDCTVPLPGLMPGEEGQVQLEKLIRRSSQTTSPYGNSNRSVAAPIIGSYLDANVRINLITQKVLTRLYSPSVASESWERVQGTITSLLAELDEWAEVALPDPSQSGAPPIKSPRHRQSLHFQYNSATILITRPCLCRLERRLKNQSADTMMFNEKRAETCVQAAKRVVDVLPDTVDPAQVYQNGPWWAIVHHMMQAMAVLLLEWSVRGTYTQGDDELPPYATKLIQWLYAMREENAVAHKAFDIVLDILKNTAPHVRLNIADPLAKEGGGSPDASSMFQDYTMYMNESSWPQEGFQPASWEPAEWAKSSIASGISPSLQVPLTSGQIPLESPTATLGSQSATSTLPEQDPYLFAQGQNFADNDFQMLPSFGNSFMTNLDSYKFPRRGGPRP